MITRKLGEERRGQNAAPSISIGRCSSRPTGELNFNQDQTVNFDSARWVQVQGVRSLEWSREETRDMSKK